MSEVKTSTDPKSDENVENTPKSPFPTQNGDGDKCSICQDTELFKDMYALPCAHKFHELCINEWLKKKQVCPICRCHVGDANNAHDEGLGDGNESDSFDDDVTAVNPHHEESFSELEFHVQEYADSDSDEEESPAGQTNREFEISSSGESRDSSDEGLEIIILTNTGNVFSSGDDESDSGESQADSDHNVFEDESDSGESQADSDHNVFEDGSDSDESYEELETSESEYEPNIVESDEFREISDASESSESEYEQEFRLLPETSESDDEQENRGSDYEPYISESSSENESGESDEEQESSKSDDARESYESDEAQESSESDEAQESHESDEAQESSESDEAQEYSESDGSVTYDSCNDSYYDSDSE